MKKTKFIQGLEFFSLTLVLTYFFIHNIYLVIIGILFSLYLINIKFINKKVDIEVSVNDKRIKTNSINLKSTKEDIKLTLVETIEELGYIPSLEKNDESNVA